MNAEKLNKLAKNVRTGGKGSVRRKRKAPHRASTDDKKLNSTLRKLGVQPIPGIDEVNMFKDDGSILHFKTPRVQANIQANTYVISGPSQDKTLEELLPGIISQMGASSLDSLKRLAEAGNFGAGAADSDDSEEMPEIDTNFDEAAAADDEEVEVLNIA